MFNLRRILQPVFCIALLLFIASPAFAQATRTWVSGVGDDANPCSRTAPCKTFAGAISKTANGGYINITDPGGFGTVTITKSITIDGDPGHAGVLASGVQGVIINGAGIRVTLRNLSIEGGPTATPGVRGVNVIQAVDVHIEHCIIKDFAMEAVLFNAGASSFGHVSDTTVINNAGGGIVVTSGRVNVSNLHAETNGNGVAVNGTATATVRDSYAAANGAGFAAISAAGVINLENCVVTHNMFGIFVATGGTARVSNSNISSNINTGLFNAGGSFIVSEQGNTVAGNTTDGTFTSTITKQ